MKWKFIHKICEFLKLPVGVRIPYFGGLWYRMLSKIENWYIRRINLPENPLNTHPRQEKVIVSLTTFPARIHQVEFAIKSLMLQSYKPDRIVLWLAENQFPEHNLPPSLLKLKGKGLEIKFCEDYKSFKKYFIALQEQKSDEVVITYDDDIIYPPSNIERAIKKHREYPHAIVCNQCQTIRFDHITGRPLPYREWTSENRKVRKPWHSTMALTGSGCLYPYGVLPSEAFDWDKIRHFAPTADDLWIKAMCILNDVKVVRTNSAAKTFSTVSNSQTIHLSQINCLQNGNDSTFEALIGIYPRIKIELLSEQ